MWLNLIWFHVNKASRKGEQKGQEKSSTGQLSYLCINLVNPMGTVTECLCEWVDLPITSTVVFWFLRHETLIWALSPIEGDPKSGKTELTTILSLLLSCLSSPPYTITSVCSKIPAMHCPKNLSGYTTFFPWLCLGSVPTLGKNTDTFWFMFYLRGFVVIKNSCYFCVPQEEWSKFWLGCFTLNHRGRDSQLWLPTWRSIDGGMLFAGKEMWNISLHVWDE